MTKIRKVVDQAYDYILDNIVSGKWPAESKIPSETEIANDLGISRMTLRTAIQKATMLGITETKQGDGTYVKKFDMSLYFNELYKLKLISNKDLLLFRNYLEIGCIRSAFNVSDFEDKIEYLNKLYFQMVKSVKQKDFESFYKIDFEFHSYICSMSDNNFIKTINKALIFIINDNLQYNAKVLYKAGPEILLEPHKLILKAMKERDIEGCFQAKFKYSSLLTQK